MSSIIKKTSSRFAPKLTQRKQSRGGTPIASKSGTPVVQKVVQLEETTEINSKDAEDVSEDKVKENPEQDQVTEAFANLKQNIFEPKDVDPIESSEAIIDDDDDPKKKSTTVLIHPPQAPNKTRRSSSIAGAPASLRKGSISDDNRRMRRLSSITSSLGAGMLRRTSVSSSSTTGTPPTRISAVSVAEPFRIDIPTGPPTKVAKPRAKSSQNKSLGKIPMKRRASRASSVAETKETPSPAPEAHAEEEPVKEAVTEPIAEPIAEQETEQVTEQVIERPLLEKSSVREPFREEPIIEETIAEETIEEEANSGAAGSSVQIEKSDNEKIEQEKANNDGEQTIVLAVGEETIQLVAPDRIPAEDSAARVSPDLETSASPSPAAASPSPAEEVEKSEPRHQRKRMAPLSFKPRKEQTKKAKRTSERLVAQAAKKQADPTFVPPEGTEEKIVTSASLSSIPRSELLKDQKKYEEYKIKDEDIKMEDLCKPVFPFGEKSEYFDLAQVAAEKKRKDAIERRKLRIEARKEGRSFIDHLEAKEKEEREKRAAEGPTDVDDTQSSKENTSNIQLKLGEGGTLALQEDSLFVDRHGGQINDDRERITENAFENPVISSTYGKRTPVDKWTSEETKTLYQALSTWGTDFNIITQLFPHRNRRQIKLKFNLEERKRPFIIDLALKRKLPIDFDDFCSQSKLKFKTMDEYNQELKELREKHEREVKEMLEAAEKQRKEDVEVQRKREVEIRTGVKSMSRAERRAELRKNEIVIGEVVKKQED